MPLTVDPISYVVSSHNKNYLDSYRGSPAHTTTSMASATGMNSMHISTSLTTLSKSQLSASQPHLQQLLTGTAKNHPQLHVNDVAITHNLSTEKLRPLEVRSNVIPVHTNVQKGQLQILSQVTPMSNILRAQLDELKHLPQPLGSNFLSSNEQQICKNFNLPPTSYLSLKTVLLSGAPVNSSNLSPIESSIRKYFIKVGWLSH